MAFQLQDKRAAFEALCHRYGVARLELFGSATTDAFDPNASDLDLLVRFQPTDVGGGAVGRFPTLLWFERRSGEPIRSQGRFSHGRRSEKPLLHQGHERESATTLCSLDPLDI